MEFLFIIALVLLFEFAAMRWGHDSRDGFRIFSHSNRTRR
jgi:hypothetical protein